MAFLRRPIPRRRWESLITEGNEAPVLGSATGEEFSEREREPQRPLLETKQLSAVRTRELSGFCEMAMAAPVIDKAAAEAAIATEKFRGEAMEGGGANEKGKRNETIVLLRV